MKGTIFSLACFLAFISFADTPVLTEAEKQQAEKQKAEKAREEQLIRDSRRDAAEAASIANQELVGSYFIIILAVNDDGVRIMQKSAASGRIKPTGAAGGDYIMVAYDGAGTPVYRSYIDDPRKVSLGVPGHASKIQVAEMYFQIKVPTTATKVEFKRWKKVTISTALGSMDLPILEVVYRLDL